MQTRNNVPPFFGKASNKEYGQFYDKNFDTQAEKAKNQRPQKQ